jgi:hypothetical protein
MNASMGFGQDPLVVDAQETVLPRQLLTDQADRSVSNKPPWLRHIPIQAFSGTLVAG